MLCPVCSDIHLAMSERNGIEIDYCPKCRGVWLDRGELDKIIEKNASHISPQPSSNQNTYQNTHSNHQQGYHKKKKESWFGELFDF